MAYTHSMNSTKGMVMIVTNEEIDLAISLLLKLIDIYAVELYKLDHQRPRDLMAEYRWQLKVDRTNEVIEEFKKYKNLN